jgi:hypothetical protein
VIQLRRRRSEAARRVAGNPVEIDKSLSYSPSISVVLAHQPGNRTEPTMSVARIALPPATNSRHEMLSDGTNGDFRLLVPRLLAIASRLEALRVGAARFACRNRSEAP